MIYDFIGYVLSRYGNNWRRRPDPRSACNPEHRLGHKDKYGRPLQAKKAAAYKNSQVLKDLNK